MSCYGFWLEEEQKNSRIRRAASVSETGTAKEQATMQAMNSRNDVARMLQSERERTRDEAFYMHLSTVKKIIYQRLP